MKSYVAIAPENQLPEVLVKNKDLKKWRDQAYKKSIFLINIISWVFVIGIIWWSQFLTSYKPFNKSDLFFSKAALGENKLVTDSGNEILVSNLISNKPFTLFVFYRGHW